MAEDLKLSASLQRLLTPMLPHADLPEGATVEIEAAGMRSMINALQIMQKMALNMELELACHRDTEAGREMRTTMEGEATDQLDDLIAETSGKIIRPNFGRKPS
ncbi:hypothetical protein RHAB21_00691 [Pseudorhizobium halotolerans]|uniref:Uncharacterized protein n=1 Tax=Pseudorhizobium halotolerans TaxID=1233081 RepID=A0ABM8PYT3_9HYPH|nr:hypothetical protein [Pseudorhizobium halotolerans]CAD7055298.1 hypothetical protein RHAB21_00691 [Pseudorhizobium halotolerans]